MPQRAPPVTIVAATRLNLRQRSNPPWASTMVASNSFTVGLPEVFHLLVSHRQRNRGAQILLVTSQCYEREPLDPAKYPRGSGSPMMGPKTLPGSGLQTGKTPRSLSHQ